MPLAPNGELTSIGIGRESSYGTAATPTLFLPADNIDFSGTNEFNERPGARRRIGRTRASTGMFMGKGSLDAEADPDNLGAILGLAFGAETVTPNVGNPTTAATVTTTSSNPIPTGVQIVTPASMTGITQGAALTVDTGANAETVTVKSILGNSFAAYFKMPHAAGVAIVNAALVLAYDHTFTFASPRPFFTAQINEVISARNCVGNKVSTLSLAATSKAILSSKITTEYQNDIKTLSPVTPTYSTLESFAYETAGNFGTINGVASDATIQGWQVDLNTGLVADFPDFGNGRLRGQIPETMTKASGSMNIAFETETLRRAFWGNVGGATGPQSIVLPLALVFAFVSTDYVNTGVAYELQLILGSVLLTGAPVAIKAGSYLTQAVKFEAYESINGASDDMKAILTNAASGASI